MSWAKVSEVVYADPQPLAIAFDGCHKIYLALDAEQVRLFQEYGYEDGDSQMRYAADTSPDEMLDTLTEWFNDSCGLRFIESVRTVEGDPNAGFEHLIEQGEEGV